MITTMSGYPVANNINRPILTISELNRTVRTLLEGHLTSIWVQGEISNLAKPASGHIYFSLKDQYAQVRCALFKNRAPHFIPENGMEVLVKADVSLYENRGDYQLLVSKLEPIGDGALLRAFEQLKTRLGKEGLFAERHKQILPTFPKTIGVISSPSGAAVRDVLSVLARRYPLAKIILYPVTVQGDNARHEIIHMLSVSAERRECDVLLLVRGGGSLEDLRPFNDEQLARAIHACPIPLVSGIGHETNLTITDLVADMHGVTPSVAAELISPDCADLSYALSSYTERLHKLTHQRLTLHKHQLASFAAGLSSPVKYIQQTRQRIDGHLMYCHQFIRSELMQSKQVLNNLNNRLIACSPSIYLERHAEKIIYLKAQLNHRLRARVNAIHQHLHHLAHKLNIINPLSTLNRGYAIISHLKSGVVIKDIHGLKKGDKLLSRLAQGEFIASVDSIRPKADIKRHHKRK